MKNRSLGRGLGALIGENNTADRDSLTKVAIDKIKPNKKQPRREFNEEKLNELMESIKMHGIIQPIIVRNHMSGYEIIAGERRWRAAKKLKLENIPVVIREADDLTMSKLAIIENIQREDLNNIEEAKAYKELISNYELTQVELSNIVGKSRSYIANIMRLLNLEEEIQSEIIIGNISGGHARAILGLNTKRERIYVMNKIIKNKFSVRKTERYIKKFKEEPSIKESLTKSDEILHFEENLSDKFDTKVNIKHNSNKMTGKIEIEYYNIEDLNRILEKL